VATWTSFADEAPDLATLAEQRMAATGLLILGTLLGASAVTVDVEAEVMLVRTWQPGKGVVRVEKRD